MFDFQIDNFLRSETPLSDSGRWYSPLLGATRDYQECGTYPLVPGGVMKQLNGPPFDILNPIPGPALAVRTDGPGVGSTQSISLTTIGFAPDMSRLLRFDLSGNGYWCTISAGGACAIWLSVGWGLSSLLASAQVGTGWIANTAIGAAVEGKTISIWVKGSGSPSYSEVLSVNDSTYSSGYVGFGSSGGIFGLASQANCFGNSAAAIPKGIQNAPVTQVFGNVPV